MPSEDQANWNNRWTGQWKNWTARDVLAWQAWRNLGPNLAVAGALCKAFWDGYGLAERDLRGSHNE